MVLGFGCVHPVGESDTYDGLYFKQNEMEQLAKDLVDKPLCIEHVPHDVGKICHAWVGTKKPELYALFDTSNDFTGCFANNLIDKGLCKDLSLGHNVTIDEQSTTVVEKHPVEVSICEKGARPDTHIYAFSKNEPPTLKIKNGNYILHMKSSTSNINMSEPTPEVSPPTEQPTEQPVQQEANPMLAELLAQMKQQQADFVQLQEKFSASETARTSAENQVAESNKRKRAERTDVIENTLKDYVKNMIEQYQKELKPHADELANLFNAMKDSEQSEPMLRLLQCAAASGKQSTSKMEDMYQEQKRLKLTIENKEKELTTLKKPAFASPSDRFVEHRSAAPKMQVRAAKKTLKLPSGIKLPRACLDGMQVRNPNLWADLSSANVGPGMGWFSEPKLVGKEYTDGRRPKKL